jgi:outer membrane protein TolC
MFDADRCRPLGFVFAALLFGASAFGQPGQPGGSAQTPAGAQAGPVSRLSIDDAVRLALEQNLSLQVQRLDPQVQQMNIDLIRTAWTPVVSGTATNASSTSPVSSFFAGATNALTNDRFGATIQADQLLPWGANYNVAWNNVRAKSNSVYDSPNPSLSSMFGGSYTQPLLRNFKIDSTRQQLLISKKNREMTDVQLRQTVVETVRLVKNAYWDLAYAFENLKVQQQSLEIARDSLRNNKSRVAIGTMAPIDIIEAEAEVARNEEAVIIAEAQISKAEDTLRQLIYDPTNPGFWTTTFELTDPPVYRAQDVDLEAAVKRALENRTDLINMRKNLEANDINIRYFKNQILPDLNVRAGYGLTGQGGTNYTFSDTFPPVPISIVDNGWGSVYSQMLSNDFHNWSVAVTVGYPIGRSSAEAALARAKIAYTQEALQLRSLEMAVATQVRDVARTLNTNRKRVDATRASRELAQRKLGAEEKRFQAGLSTNFFVVQAQRDLASAKNAELQAVLDYSRSLVDFETVQEAPVIGGSISLAVAARVGQVQ